MSVLTQIWIKDGQERVSKLYIFDKEILSSCYKKLLKYCPKSKDAIKLHKYLTNYKLHHKQHFAHGEASKTNQ